MDNTIRRYEEDRDFESIERIWREVAWIDDSKEHSEGLRHFLSVGSTLTAAVNDAAECCVHTTPGAIRCREKDLSLCVVSAVTTSHIGRKQGFARKLTALQLAESAAQGADVAALGMFEQGFYDQLGFGTGSYEHWLTFDPAKLIVNKPFRTPERLGCDDWQAIYKAMMTRKRGHAGCVLIPPEIVRAELAWTENSFGLGYTDEGVLTHFIWGAAKGEHGPYEIEWIAYRNMDQLLELMALLKGLGDQVSTVSMTEPSELQIQTMLVEPFRSRRLSGSSTPGNQHTACAEWQLRVLDVPACISACSSFGPPVSFNLMVSDPLSTLLEGADWNGCQGEYSVTLSDNSTAKREYRQGLPQVKCSVNALSRLLFGTASASTLAATDDFNAPVELLESLDRALLTPRASPGWKF